MAAGVFAGWGLLGIGGLRVDERGREGVTVVSGAVDELAGDGHVGLGSDGCDVVEDDRLPEARGFGEPDVPGDDGLEDFRPEIFARIGGDLPGEIEACVVHRQEDAVDGEVGVDAPLDHVDRAQELGESFEGVVLALEGDEDGVGGGEHVDRDEAERRGAVDEDEVVEIASRGDGLAHDELSVGVVDELDLGAGEVRSGGGDVEVLELHGVDGGVEERALADEGVVDGPLDRVPVDPDPAGRVSLGVAVDEEGPLFGDSEACCEVDGGSGLADTALLVCDCDDPGHVVPLRVSGVWLIGERLCRWDSARNIPEPVGCEPAICFT